MSLHSSIIAVLVFAVAGLACGSNKQPIRAKRDSIVAARADSARRAWLPSHEVLDPVTQKQRRADRLLATLSPEAIQRLPDTTLNFLDNYGSQHRDLIRREQARRQRVSEQARLQPALAPRGSRHACVHADGSAAPGYQRLEMNLWPGQRLHRTTTCEYVADVIEIDEDGDVMLRTVADGDMVTFPRRFVQANFVAATR